MKKKNNYYVIGGQYEKHCIGGAPTLLGAKRLASANEEYWDNWQGWHTPPIYRAEDTELIETLGWITKPDGVLTRLPRWDAIPIAEKVDGKWMPGSRW